MLPSTWRALASLPGAGGEVGEGLGGDGQAQPRPAALVEQLDEGIVDRLGGLVDEDVDGRGPTS
jgi:hypothetical protein